MPRKLTPADVRTLQVPAKQIYFRDGLAKSWETDRTENKWLWRIAIITSLLAMVFIVPGFACFLHYIQIS